MVSAYVDRRFLQNTKSSLTIDLYGGALTDFHLHEDKINPLRFRFTSEQMPENNKAGAPFQGHFICLGRWGAPSEGEIKAGVPNHGQLANMLWRLEEANEQWIKMKVTSHLEGMQVNRTIEMDADNAIFTVEESVKNINPLGRLYNMVQHPTLGRPFLNNSTIVDCNAEIGFDQYFSENPINYASKWPLGICHDLTTIDLRTPNKPYNSVFSFIMNKSSKYGWITVYAPQFKIVFGYVWRRKDYPWLHLWQDWSGNKIRYRGIEFGTAGIHKPFKEILAVSHLFGEKTFEYIDAGETVFRRYLSFLTQVPEDFAGVSSLEINNGQIIIRGRQEKLKVYLNSTLKKLI